MNLYEYLKLPTTEKILFCNRITPTQVMLNPDIKLINEIFTNLIESCNRFNIDLVKLLNNNELQLPSTVQTLYEVGEGSILNNLPLNKWNESHHKLWNLRQKIREESENEKQRKFDELKIYWCEHYPDFAEISRIMNLYLTSEILVEFGKKSIPESIINQALEVFKKTISFKTSNSDKKLIKALTDSRYRFYKYCIQKDIAITFQDEFLDWVNEISNLWQEVYYSKEDFFNNTGYDRTSWETYIRYPGMLERKKRK